MPDCLDRDVRHRHGLPWYAAQVPHRWHFCRPHIDSDTIEESPQKL